MEDRSAVLLGGLPAQLVGLSTVFQWSFNDGRSALADLSAGCPTTVSLWRLSELRVHWSEGAAHSLDNEPFNLASGLPVIYDTCTCSDARSESCHRHMTNVCGVTVNVDKLESTCSASSYQVIFTNLPFFTVLQEVCTLLINAGWRSVVMKAQQSLYKSGTFPLAQSVGLKSDKATSLR